MSEFRAHHLESCGGIVLGEPLSWPTNCGERPTLSTELGENQGIDGPSRPTSALSIRKVHDELNCM
jgi:hypothetical protein